jgi:hypothetical protein
MSAARPRHQNQDAKAIEAFKKNLANTLSVHLADVGRLRHDGAAAMPHENNKPEVDI